MERIKIMSVFRQSLVPLLFVWVGVIGVFPTILGLFDRWRKFDESYSHGFLVFFISLYLCLNTWRRLRPEPGIYLPWFLPLVASVLVYLAGQILLIEAFQQLALIPIFFSGLLVLWGWRQTLPFLIPVGLLTFALPLWDYASWPLQLITVEVNQFMLSRLDVEFVVEGVFVYFPGVGAFEIAHGCSGLRYLLVGVTLSLLYGELNLRTWRNRIGLVLCAVLFALLANWIRVFIIIYVGYESNMTSSLINEHDFFGWWVFGATLIPLFFVARWLESREELFDASGPDASPGQALSSFEASIPAQLLVILPVLMLVISLCISGGSSKASQIGSPKPRFSLVDSNHWMPLFVQDLNGWSPNVVGADRYVEGAFIRRHDLKPDGASDQILFVGLYTYDYQRPGAEVVQYNNRLYDTSYQLPDRTFEVSSGSGVELSGLTLRYRQSSEHIHVAYGYYVEGRWERLDLQAKLAQLPGIFNNRSDASMLVIGLQCDRCDADDILETIATKIRLSAQNYLDELYAVD